MQTGENDVNGVNGVVEGDQEMVNVPEEQVTTGAGITGERQPNKVRVTTPYLTKYERARILGTRALQIRFLIINFTVIFFPPDFRLMQHECSCSRSSGRRDRCSSNRHQRTLATENSINYSSIPA